MNKKNTIKFAIKHGFLHIFSANVINKVVQFGITILFVRILSKTDYGSFVYAQNILNLILLLQGLGVVSGILQYCSEENDEVKKLSYLKFGLKMGMIVNVIISLLILFYTTFFQLPIKGSTEILMMLSVFPVISIIFEIIQVFFRATLKNKEFSILTMVNSILYFVGNMVLGILMQIKGIIISRYISFIISVILGIYLLRDCFKKLKVVEYPSKKSQKEFFKYSLTCSITNAISQALFLLDTFFVGLIVKDQSIVASYKSSTLIPFNLMFIPTSIIIFTYPYFAKHWNDKEWVRKQFFRLQNGLFIFNSILSIFLIIFAKQVILILFGSKYLDSIFSFRILMLGYLIAGTFRITAGNVLLSIKKVKVNFYNSMISGIANILLDIILIKKYGAIGASVATVLVFIISSLISNIYIIKYLKADKKS